MHYVKMASSAPPPVLTAFKEALTIYRTNCYKSLNTAFFRFSQDAVRSFPRPQLIVDVLEFLRGRVSDDVIAKVGGCSVASGRRSATRSALAFGTSSC
jgi:hypothetical protein